MGYDRTAAVAHITQDSLSKNSWPVDNEPSSRFPIFTRANIGEVFPEVVKPFSWTLWGIPHSEPGWRQALFNLGAFDSKVHFRPHGNAERLWRLRLPQCVSVTNFWS